MNRQKRKLLEMRIEDLKGVIERRSWNVDRESIQRIEVAKRNLREAQLQLQLLIEEENRLG